MSQPVFSSASLSPTEVLAADSAEFVITLTIGPGYTPDVSRLIVDFPATLGMSRPSIFHQEESGYLVTRVSNPEVSYTTRVWDMEIKDFPTRTKGSWRGMAARLGVVDVSAGLKEGDTVEIRWGDTGGGFGPGTKVTSVVPRPGYESLVHVRYFASQDAGLPDMGRDYDGYTRPVPDYEAELRFAVKPRAASFLRCIRSAQRALLVPHDMLWNVAEVQKVSDVAECSDVPRKNDFGVFSFDAPHVAVRSRTLPLRDCPSMDNVHEGYNLYWGDIHTHTAFSNDCIEREKLQMLPGDLMAFARQQAGLDFYAPTDHNEPHHEPRNHIGRARWEQTVEAARAHDAPGEFLAFVGMEYRCTRGDTAVVFKDFPSWNQVGRSEFTDVRRLWELYDGGEYLSIPHFHNGGGLAENEWWENIGSGVETVLEMFSCHGSYERPDAFENGLPLVKSRRPDRFASWMLSQGYRYGMCCNSDGHKGHVGYNGVTAVFAKELTKDAIFEAYRQRRVYGTTNARIRLVFTANGVLMGSVAPNAAKKTLRVEVTGESALKKVELFRNTELHARFVPSGMSYSTELVVEDDAPSFWYVRATQQDSHVAWSSPIWFE